MCNVTGGAVGGSVAYGSSMITSNVGNGVVGADSGESVRTCVVDEKVVKEVVELVVVDVIVVLVVVRA